MRSQLCERTAHMINCVIADTIAATQNRLAKTPPPAIGYAFAIHQLTSTEHRFGTLCTQHFLGAIIDEETGKMLEYRHLITNASTRKVWEGLTLVSLSARARYHRTNGQRMVALFAISAHRRRSSIARSSLLGGIESIILATRPRQLQTSPQPNCSSAPPSARPAPSSLGLT